LSSAPYDISRHKEQLRMSARLDFGALATTVEEMTIHEMMAKEDNPRAVPACGCLFYTSFGGYGLDGGAERI
jgi:hypothetical protein